ncbi:MAG TPA: cytochrome c [Acidobacteria bacterium]|nr:cytochrome c [Acidobacteriota bacterium]
MPVSCCLNRCQGATMACMRLAAWSLAPVVLASAVAGAQTPTRLSFTDEQAEEGRVAYAERCASCHGDALDDGEVAPPLKGADFRERWRAETPDALFNLTADTMPQDQPGVLDEATYAAVVAFMYRENGSGAGSDPLPDDPELLAGLAPPRWRGCPHPAGAPIVVN